MVSGSCTEMGRHAMRDETGGVPRKPLSPGVIRDSVGSGPSCEPTVL